MSRASWPHGVWFGIDVGTVRVGVARSDVTGTIASPITTLARDAVHNQDLDDIVALVTESAAVGVVVGLPRTLKNREGQSAEMARAYAALLEQRLDVPVELVDERLTTVQARRTLDQHGLRGRAQRAVVDQAAAAALLQHWLDTYAAR